MQMQNTRQEILQQTKEVDAKWRDMEAPETLERTFHVPMSHVRHQAIPTYLFRVGPLQSLATVEGDLMIVDKKNSRHVEKFTEGKAFRILEPLENETKTLHFLNNFLRDLGDVVYKRVITIGDGVTLSIGGFIAERLQADLVQVPTTIISMSDTCIGGKVRVNDIQEGVFRKNAHRSYYEPSLSLVDPAFLEPMNDHQLRYGLAKIIQHALYQSEGLLEYLLSDAFDPFTNRKSLLKAILWSVELKQACLDVDPYETPGGSGPLLRAAHDISDKLEEESGLIMSHGEAVLRAMELDLGYDRVRALYKKLGIYFRAL